MSINLQQYLQRESAHAEEGKGAGEGAGAADGPSAPAEDIEERDSAALHIAALVLLGDNLFMVNQCGGLSLCCEGDRELFEGAFEVSYPGVAAQQSCAFHVA